MFVLEARINRIWKGIDYEGGKPEETIKIDSRDSVFCSQMNAVPFTEIQQWEREFGGEGSSGVGLGDMFILRCL